MLKSVDNLTASPEGLAGAPVEVSVEKPINVSIFTSFYGYSKFGIFLISEKVSFALLFNVQNLKS